MACNENSNCYQNNPWPMRVNSLTRIIHGQRLEERELRSLEEHPPLADLRPIHFASNLKRAVGERSFDSTTPYKCGNRGS
jgi:hypothetical protein